MQPWRMPDEVAMEVSKVALQAAAKEIAEMNAKGDDSPGDERQRQRRRGPRQVSKFHCLRAGLQT